MVVNTPLPVSAPLKRSMSSMKDGYAGWECVSPTRPLAESPINLPYAHYAVIYYDNMGKINVSESPSIQGQARAIFTPDVRERFLETIGPMIGYHKPLIHRPAAVPQPQAQKRARDVAQHHQGKRRKASARDVSLETSFRDNSPSIQQTPSPSANTMVAMKIGDTEKVLEYYVSALMELQQHNCRHIAKSWIKAIQPKKQRSYPYNGGPRKKGEGPKDPEKTKPEWWPEDVIHKEPDHLKRDGRVRLLIHLLRNPRSTEFTAEQLQEVAEEQKRHLIPKAQWQQKWEQLKEIFKVRKLEERYELGEVDASTVVYVRGGRKASTKNAGAAAEEEELEEENTEQKLEDDDYEETEADPLTFATSSHVSHSAFVAVDPVALQNRSFSLGNEQSQPFSLDESFTFEEPARQSRSFYHTPAEYSNGFSPHPAIKHEPSALMSPDEHPGAFDYLTSMPFTGPEQHRPMTLPMHQSPIHQPSQFENWYPQYRTPAYNSMEYGASHGSLPQSPMQYPMSVNNAHSQDIPHGLPDMTRGPSHMGHLGSRNSLNRSF